MRLALLLLPLCLAACSTPRAPAPVPPAEPVSGPLAAGITPLTVEQERELRR